MTMNLTRALICLPALFAINVLAASNTPAVPDAATVAAPDAHLDYPPGKAPKFWSVATAETIMARWPDYNLAYHASWTYVHGYALYGFDMLYRATGDKKILRLHQALHRQAHRRKRRLPGRGRRPQARASDRLHQPGQHDDRQHAS